MRSVISSAPYQQFDEQWYIEKYPDVVHSGMKPYEHFIKYGALLGRDPNENFSNYFYTQTYKHIGKEKVDWSATHPLIEYFNQIEVSQPNYKKILLVCNELIQKGRIKQSLELAKKYLPSKLSNTLSILEVNKAAIEGNQRNWLLHLNRYLSKHNLEPLQLNNAKNLLDKLVTDTCKLVTNGPKISVIMAAWNAEKTIVSSVKSILNQTWRNLELIIVDDASSDNTWLLIKALANKDHRIKIHQMAKNSGPYVCKNLALKTLVEGDYITGHDADDWSHPQRLERHFALALECGSVASIINMLRLNECGQISKISQISPFTYDGAARKALISCLFEKKFLNEKLGYWDSVRVGADSEMLARAKMAAGDRFKTFPMVALLCLDLSTSLTNNVVTGIGAKNGAISNERMDYKNKWTLEHDLRKKSDNWYKNFDVEI